MKARRWSCRYSTRARCCSSATATRLQADGEPTGTGIETSLDVTFTVELRKRAHVNNPRVETPEYIIAVGSQPEFVSSLDRSLRVATSEMVDWLVRDYKMEPWAAHMLIGYQGQYDVVTVAGSMALRLPRSSLPALRDCRRSRAAPACRETMRQCSREWTPAVRFCSPFERGSLSYDSALDSHNLRVRDVCADA